MPKHRNDAEIISAVKSSISVAETLRRLSLKEHNGGNYRWLYSKIKKLRLDTSHWTAQPVAYQPHSRTAIPLTDILVEHSTYLGTAKLKARLLKAGFLRAECYMPDCGITDWRGQELVLHLDHINGVFDDNRLENLRLLCPNCHSQTVTYCRGTRQKQVRHATCQCGIRIQKRSRTCTRCRYTKLPKVINKCAKCHTTISKRRTHCKKCVPKPSKIQWPPIDTLRAMLERSSYLAVGKQLGVSDNAIRKHLRNHL